MAAHNVAVPKDLRVSHAEWLAEGTRLFGEDPRDWAFVCPSCGHVCTIGEWRDAGAPEGEIAFTCIGRRIGGRDAFDDAKPGPCNYAGAGLIKYNPVTVEFPNGKTRSFFAFADRSAVVRGMFVPASTPKPPASAARKS